MAIITISRGSFSKGQEVAEQAAARLGYTCVSRDVLLDASDRFHIPEIKLKRAIHDAPSVLDRITHGKQLYITYIQSALARAVQKDDVIYHGFAGHLLLKNVDHMLKVRVIADLADRIADEMARDGISEGQARERIVRDDHERQKWTRSLYGVDPTDPSLYDIVVHVGQLTVGDAVDLVCSAVSQDQFKTTAESQRKMDDLVTACSVKAALVEQYPEIAVSCEYGNVVVRVKKEDRHMRRLEVRARELAGEMGEINNLEVHAGGNSPPPASELALEKEVRSMPSITISADTRGGGKAIAIEIAASLGYRYLGTEFLVGIGKSNEIPEQECSRVSEPESVTWPSIPRKLKESLTVLQEGVVEAFLEDEIVSEGFAAHLFLQRVPHILNVRVLVDLEQRQRELIEAKDISPKRARSIIEKQDKLRLRWSEKLFGVNEADPTLYDLLIPLGEVGEERAVKIIADRVGDPQFNSTTYSVRCLEDQLVAARVRAALVKQFPKVEVTVSDGDVVLQFSQGASNWRKSAEEMKSIVSGVDGVGRIELRKGRTTLVS